MPNLGRSVITNKQRFEAFRILREVTEPTGEEGVIRYKSGWSDVNVGAKVGVTDKQIARLRTDALGKIINHPGQGGISKRVGKVEEQNAALVRAFNALCDQLGVQSLKI